MWYIGQDAKLERYRKDRLPGALDHINIPWEIFSGLNTWSAGAAHLDLAHSKLAVVAPSLDAVDTGLSATLDAEAETHRRASVYESYTF